MQASSHGRWSLIVAAGSFIFCPSCLRSIFHVFVYALIWQRSTWQYCDYSEQKVYDNLWVHVVLHHWPSIAHCLYIRISGKRDRYTMNSWPSSQPNATRPECCVKERTWYWCGTWKMGFRTWSTTLHSHWSPWNQSWLSAGEDPQSKHSCGSYLFC